MPSKETNIEPCVELFFFSSRRRHTRSYGDWSSDVCSSDLAQTVVVGMQPAVAITLAELDQRDGDGRLHAHHHRLRVEDAAHAGDVRQHPADEGVDDVQRADVDEHPARLVLGDAGGQVFLELHGQAVVHVHLDRHQQVVAHAEDRDAFHGYSRSLRSLLVSLGFFMRGAATRTTVWPVRCSASAKASASVALVVTFPRSTPRCTMVCAICGLTPLMMQSAPISRAAAMVLSRCWATSVSTVGTPVMSRIATALPVSTIRCSNVSITTCVRAESRVPIMGS